MASRLLDKTTKHTIAIDARDDAFEEVLDSVREEMRIIGNKIRKAITGDIQEHIDALPDFMLVRGDYFRVVEGVDGKTKNIEILCDEQVLWPNCHWAGMEYSGDRKLIEKYLAFQEEYDDLIKKRNALFDKIMQMLRPIRSVKRLEQDWPEGMKYLPEEINTEEAKLPAVTSDEINECITRYKQAV